jgi:hypothetical protein
MEGSAEDVMMSAGSAEVIVSVTVDEVLLR